MIQTVATIFLLVVAVLIVPVWAQIVAFCVAVLTVPYKVILLAPAVFADVLYAPTKTLAFGNLKMTGLVALLLLAHWFIMTRTRISHVYGLEKK